MIPSPPKGERARVRGSSVLSRARGTLASYVAKLRSVRHQPTHPLERALLQLQHHERIDGAVFIVQPALLRRDEAEPGIVGRMPEDDDDRFALSLAGLEAFMDQL